MGMVEVNQTSEGVDVVINNRRVFVDAEDNEVRIWDEEVEHLLAVIDIQTGEVKE